MKKNALFVSLIVNVVLALLIILQFWSHEAINKESHFIDEVRMRDVKMLESLMIGRISKSETLHILQGTQSSSNFFDKPEEHGVGVGHLFLVFDEDNKLSKIDTNSFSGP